ncbi:hypothetical protein BH23VER1_BH23VER1_25690 [soil metagenome]
MKSLPAILLGIVLATSAPAAPAFDAEILPIFKAKCTQCHGLLFPQKGLRLTSLKNVLKGGDSGPAIIPGTPERSLLVQQFDLPKSDPKRMPPAAANLELTPSEKATISRWIAAGAR